MNSLNGFSWSDGSKWEYRNWMKGSPYRQPTQPNVLTLNWDSEFMETSSRVPLPFLCQQTLLNKKMRCVVQQCYFEAGRRHCPDGRTTFFPGSGKCYGFFDKDTIHSVAGLTF